MEKMNMIGAITAIILMALCCLVFIFRLYNQKEAEYWAGIAFMLTAIPLIYLLFSAIDTDRPTLYYIQLGTMIGFIIIELFLDYIFTIDFRHIRWMTITYVVVFFAGTGGMIGIASQAGKAWMYSSIVLFFIMAFLAFYQRVKTGL